MQEAISRKMVWNIEDLGAALGRSERSIRIDMHRQNWLRIPPPTRLGGTLAWRPQDVADWLEERAKASGAIVGSPSNHTLARRKRGRPAKSQKTV